MKIVTSGASYVDIDVYGGCVAYAELLQLQGQQAVAVSTGPLNASVSRTVRSWQAPLLADYNPAANDTFAVIDVSNPEYFDKIVDLSRVDEVIDHHVGFEKYWQERVGRNAHIEFIGAACTLVYEQWKAAGLLGSMSTRSARLLICGILDNTLNFGAKVTSQRDIDAYNALLTRADLPDDWTAQYFSECEEDILSGISSAIQNDAKTIEFKTYPKPMRVGQLAVWNSEKVLAKQPRIREALSLVQPAWFLNLISIGERKSYFVTENPGVQSWLTKLFGVTFTGPVGAADHVWLRKEIIKQDIETTKSEDE